MISEKYVYGHLSVTAKPYVDLIKGHRFLGKSFSASATVSLLVPHKLTLAIPPASSISCGVYVHRQPAILPPFFLNSIALIKPSFLDSTYSSNFSGNVSLSLILSSP